MIPVYCVPVHLLLYDEFLYTGNVWVVLPRSPIILYSYSFTFALSIFLDWGAGVVHVYKKNKTGPFFFSCLQWFFMRANVFGDDKQCTCTRLYNNIFWRQRYFWLSQRISLDWGVHMAHVSKKPVSALAFVHNGFSVAQVLVGDSQQNTWTRLYIIVLYWRQRYVYQFKRLWTQSHNYSCCWFLLLLVVGSSSSPSLLPLMLLMFLLLLFHHCCCFCWWCSWCCCCCYCWLCYWC